MEIGRGLARGDEEVDGRGRRTHATWTLDLNADGAR